MTFRLVSPADSVEEGTLLPSISVVVPIYNEAENLPLLIEAIHASLTPTNLKLRNRVRWTTPLRMGQGDILKGLARQDDRLKAVMLRRNYGPNCRHGRRV